MDERAHQPAVAFTRPLAHSGLLPTIVAAAGDHATRRFVRVAVHAVEDLSPARRPVIGVPLLAI